jgi:hypothetical protein
LAYLPFEELGGGKRLIERFAISYSPSASALATLRERAGEVTPPAKALLAFGDAVYASPTATVSRGSLQSPGRSTPSPRRRRARYDHRPRAPLRDRVEQFLCREILFVRSHATGDQDPPVQQTRCRVTVSGIARLRDGRELLGARVE